MNMELFIYIISTGAYSSYSVECLAISKRKWSDVELDKLIDIVKTNYINKGNPNGEYQVDNSQLWNELDLVLTKNGFSIVYPAGEFHYDDYSSMEDLCAFEH